MSAIKTELHDQIESGLREMTPSMFMKTPWASVLQNSESETIARNLMVILNRTGNKFRELTWDEYKSERLKDGGFTEKEELYFKDVFYLAFGNPKDILGFSDSWKEAYDKSVC